MASSSSNMDGMLMTNPDPMKAIHLGLIRPIIRTAFRVSFQLPNRSTLYTYHLGEYGKHSWSSSPSSRPGRRWYDQHCFLRQIDNRSRLLLRECRRACLFLRHPIEHRDCHDREVDMSDDDQSSPCSNRITHITVTPGGVPRTDNRNHVNIIDSRVSGQRTVTKTH
jgi:hypothetical protein